MAAQYEIVTFQHDLVDVTPQELAPCTEVVAPLVLSTRALAEFNQGGLDDIFSVK